MKFIVPLCIGILSTYCLKAQDDLDKYIDRLKQSQASGGSETAFLSVGSTFLYGQGYFEKKEYDLAAMYFKQAYQKDSANPFTSYQIAASLLKQKDKYKAQEAQYYLNKAIQINPSLASRFFADFPQYKKNNTPVQDQPTQAATGGVAKYIDDLKYSRSTGGAKTTMNSPGLDVLYGYEYYVKGTFDLAEMRFRQAVAKDPSDSYANYLLGVSLSAQGKNDEAASYLKKAFEVDAGLKKQFTADQSSATAQYKKLQEAKALKPSSSTITVYGGKLVLGNYTCTETVWNGPNTSPAYSYPYKGYFALKADGTYRWLDNGATGKYSYDDKTGDVKWLSGYFTNMKVKSSQYKPGNKVAQITINFSDSYRWECGCNK